MDCASNHLVRRSMAKMMNFKFLTLVEGWPMMSMDSVASKFRLYPLEKSRLLKRFVLLTLLRTVQSFGNIKFHKLSEVFRLKFSFVFLKSPCHTSLCAAILAERRLEGFRKRRRCPSNTLYKFSLWITVSLLSLVNSSWTSSGSSVCSSKSILKQGLSTKLQKMATVGSLNKQLVFWSLATG